MRTELREYRFEVSPGRTMNYAVRPGEGRETLVLVHGLGARWQTFRRLITSFPPDWTIYAPDQRGHGRSDWTPGQYALSDFRDDLVAFVRRIVGRGAFVYGHSLGGWATALAAPHLDPLVEAVAIEDSALYRPSERQRARMADYVYPNAVLRGVNPALRQADPTLESRWTTSTAHQEQDPAAMLGDLTVPLLLVRGDVEAGGLLTARAARRALGHVNVPHHELYVPDAPHVVHAKAPEAVQDAIVRCATEWGSWALDVR